MLGRRLPGALGDGADPRAEIAAVAQRIHLEAEDRAHRIGQTHPVLVTYLLLDRSEWSTDFWMDSKIRAKQAAIDAVLGSSEGENSIRKLAMSRVPLALVKDT